MLAGLLSLSWVGCAGPDTRAEDAQQLTDEPTDAEILYRAILDTYQERGIDVAVSNEEDVIVMSPWVELNTELRRRYVSRGLGGRGLALRVIAQFERRDRTGPEPAWVPAEDGLTIERARREERELGEAIQARFKRAMKRR